MKGYGSRVDVRGSLGEVTFRTFSAAFGARRHPRRCCLQPTEPRAAIPCPVLRSASSCPSPLPAAAPRGFGFDFRFSCSSCLTFVCCLGRGIMALRKQAGTLRSCCWHSPTAWRPKISLLLQVPSSGGFSHPSAAFLLHSCIPAGLWMPDGPSTRE